MAGLVAEMVGPDVRVVEAHMELAPPTIAEGLATLAQEGIHEVRVVPYFLGPGRHATKDIPAMVADAAAQHPNLSVTVAPPLGVHANLARVVLDRAGLKEAGEASAEGCTNDPATCTATFCRRR